jgi:LCP family protein required for cell wall assembly
MSDASDNQSTNEAPPPSPRRGRTKRQRALVGLNILLSFALIASGSVLFFTNYKLGQRKVVTLDSTPSADNGELNLPPGDLTAKNYLITGADNNSCIPKGSKYFGGIGNRSGFGERSDTIMIIRVQPANNRAAIVSVPRDMFVTIAGTGHKSKINSAFDKKDPTKLIKTIYQNFGIPIDHYVSIDFCTFKEVVDAIGGVRVPFLYPTRDLFTGFYVKTPGCATLSGLDALAYVRSRHYRYFDTKKNVWVTGQGGDDWGRINRQQDFTKRMAHKALDTARTNPRAAVSILNAALKNIVTDDTLTPMMLLQLGQAMKNFDTSTMGSYTMPGIGQLFGNQSVIAPDTASDTAKAILAVFQGKASIAKPVATATVPVASGAVATTLTTIAALAGATTTVPKTTTTVKATTTTVKSSGTTTTVAGTPASGATTTTLPEVVISQNKRGIIPPDDPSCAF